MSGFIFCSCSSHRRKEGRFPVDSKIRYRRLLRFSDLNRLLVLASLLIVLTILFGCAAKLRHPEAAFQKGKWEVARHHAELWLAEHPRDTTVIEILGRSALAMGDSAGAVDVLSPYALSFQDKDFRRIILDASIASGRLNLARTLIRREARQDKQDTLLDQKFAIVERRISDAVQAGTQGDKSMAEEDWTRAARHYRTALKHHAEEKMFRAKLHLAQAELIIQNSDQPNAESAYNHIESCLKIWHDSPLAWWVKGDISMKLGNDDLAREAFAESLRLGIEKPFEQRANAVVQSEK